VREAIITRELVLGPAGVCSERGEASGSSWRTAGILDDDSDDREPELDRSTRETARTAWNSPVGRERASRSWLSMRERSSARRSWKSSATTAPSSREDTRRFFPSMYRSSSSRISAAVA
jgi:hypothetical protein